MAKKRRGRTSRTKKHNTPDAGTTNSNLRSDGFSVEEIRSGLQFPVECVWGQKGGLISLSAVHGEVTIEDLRQLRLQIDDGSLLVNNIRPVHSAYIVDGQKPVEGRPYALPQPWPRWIGHVTNARTKKKPTGGVRDTTRHPRTHTTTARTDGKMGPITSSEVEKQRPLKHNVSFAEQQARYERNDASRPNTGYPKESLSGLVLYGGEMTKPEEQSEEVRPWLRGFKHSWRVKAVLVFGAPIMGVRGENGRGLVNVSKELRWWGVLESEEPNTELLAEIRRRLGFLYDMGAKVPPCLRDAMR